MIEFIFLLVRTLICYLLAGVVILFTVLPMLILLIVVPQRMLQENRLLFWLLDLFYRAIVGALLLPTKITGISNMPKKPAIIIANHQSALDIPVVGCVLQQHPHVWYALSYYVNTPVLGFFIRRLGIPVDRNNGTTAARSLRQGVKFAKEHESHIIIFPEGGRFNDGTVHEFLQGFVLLARTSGRPVVPIFMPHNGKIYPPYSFWIYWHPLKVVIGPEFVYAEHDTDETFVRRVHAWFDQQPVV